MTWIKTVPLSEAGDDLREALEAVQDLFPVEYATPVHPTPGGASGIVDSHSLLPEALRHAFSTFGVLMAPDLPLSREQHEMIATRVSVLNRCHY
jgi:alkylhydroperoxidase family enzyme